MSEKSFSQTLKDKGIRLEAAIFDFELELGDLLFNLFECEELDFSYVALPSGYIRSMSEYMTNTKFSCLINFPFGLACPSIKEAEMMQTIRHGAKGIDLTLNKFDIINHKYPAIRSEVTTGLKICKAAGVDFRVILDHKYLSQREYVRACERLMDYGVETIINGTGHVVDDPYDNIGIAEEVMSILPLDVIPSSYRWNKDFLDLMIGTNITSARICSSRIPNFQF